MDTLNMLSVQMNNMVKLLSRQIGVGPSSSSNVCRAPLFDICVSSVYVNVCEKMKIKGRGT